MKTNSSAGHRTWFRNFANRSAEAMGSSTAFSLAVLSLVVWGFTGPLFHWSDTWQLVINTATNIITFLMVFLIQNSQNRDAKAMQLKLDELLRGVAGARTRLVKLEDLGDEDLEKLRAEFKDLQSKTNS